jgi:hypothetical protein
MQACIEALLRLSDACVRPCFGEEKTRQNNEEGKKPFDQSNSRTAHRGNAACCAFAALKSSLPLLLQRYLLETYAKASRIQPRFELICVSANDY